MKISTLQLQINSFLSSVRFNKILPTAVIALLLLIGGMGKSWGQTNPTAFDLSTGSWTLTGWNSGVAAGSYPINGATGVNATTGVIAGAANANMVFWRTGTQDPSLVSTPASDYIGVYNGSSGARMNGEGTNGFSFTNTGTTGNLGIAVLSVNTIGRTNINVAWTGRSITAAGGNRIYRIRLQYRITNTGSWTDFGTPPEYEVNTTAGHSQTFSNVLPAACENQSIVQLRWFYYYISGSNTRPTMAVDEITVSSLPSAGSSAALANITQPTGSIIQGNNDVVLSGFTITPSASIDFTAVTVTGSGTATSTDIANVRIFRDNDASGTINGGDVAVSGAGLPYAASIAFTISGETGFSTVRNYLIVADVAGVGVSTVGRTVTASVGSGAFTTTATTNTGSATGNSRVIAAPPGTSTISAGGGTEPATISSLINTQGAALLNFDITVTDDGATPATDAAATQISQIIFNQGTGNTVANWTLAIAGAELSDGTNTLTGTINNTNVTFSAIPNTVGTLGYIADDAAKTYTLKVWLNANMTTLKTTIDGLRLVFRVQTADVTASGSQLAAAQDQNSGAGNNAITVDATALAYVQNATTTAINAAMTPAVTVSANDANGNRDLDFISQVRITSTGVLTGSPVDNAAVAGLATFSTLTHTAGGTALTLNAERTGTLDWDITSSTFNVTNPPVLTEVIFPQYIQGLNGTNNNRVPFAYRATLSNLTPNATYRYFNGVELTSASATSVGAGNCIYPDPIVANNFVYTTSPGLSTLGSYGTFTTDAVGSYSGWFIIAPSGNATRFIPGNDLYTRIALNNGAGGTATATVLSSTNTIRVINLVGSAGVNNGTGLRGNSSAVDKSFAFVYDNINGTGRPLSGTFVENDGAAETASFATFYTASVDGISGAYGLIVPNTNANGVKRIEFKNFSDNNLLYAVTDNDGVWNGTVNTVNPTGGTTALVMPNVYDDFTVVNNTTTSTATSVRGVLTVNSGATLTTGGNLTLKSDANGTARVANSAGTISGDVTVERYINSDVVGRKWHLLSGISTVTTQNIRQSWQENATAVNNLGTWITSGAAVLPGYDDVSGNNASILRHNQATPAWVIPAATNTGSINDNQGYMLFVRGDRNATAANALTAPTVLRTTGALRQGTVNATVSSVGAGNTLIGNPYASPIDMEKILADGVGAPISNLDQNFMVWDPSIAGQYGVGGFRAVVRTGINAYNQTPVFLGTPTVNNDPTIQFIHSGSAFFLHATGADVSVAFTEATKATAPTVVYNPIVATAGDQQIIANLLTVQGNTESLVDGIRVMYNDAYKVTTTDDIIKMGNFNENLSSYRDSKKLIVEKRPMITAKDTIFLRMTNTGIKDYRFQVGTIDFVQIGVTAYLEDTYKGSKTVLDLTGGINKVDFSITTDAASANQDRFRIVFAAAAAPQPQTNITIKATQQGKAIAVEWKAANQYDMNEYQVERSTDGISYTKVNTQAATGANGSDVIYRWLDVNPLVGSLQNPATNFYRIRGVDLSAGVKITDAVNVKMGVGSDAITVYPNPVTGHSMSVRFTGMQKGTYRVNVFNLVGQVVFTRSVNHNGGSGTQLLAFDKGIAHGNYRLEIVNPDGSKTTQAIIITE